MPVEALAVEPSPKSSHRYAVQDGFEYGYQGAISEVELSRGQVASALRMFTYLGEHAGLYQVMLRDGDFRTVAECDKVCEYAKVYTFAGDRFVRRELLPVLPGMLLAEVFEDAMNGHLDQYKGTRGGKLVHLWVDGEKKRVIHVPVNTSPRLPS